MKVAVKVSTDLEVELGLSIEDLVERLDKSSVEYENVYDKVNANTGILETVFFIREEGMEILLEGHKVVYIKSACNEFNTIIEDGSKVDLVEAVGIITKFIQERSSASEDDIYLERLNGETMAVVMAIHDSESLYRVNVVMNSRNTIYMTTVRDAYKAVDTSEELEAKLEQYRG